MEKNNYLFNVLEINGGKLKMYTYEELKVTLKKAYQTTDYKEFQKLKKRMIQLLDKLDKEKAILKLATK